MTAAGAGIGAGIDRMLAVLSARLVLSSPRRERWLRCDEMLALGMDVSRRADLQCMVYIARERSGRLAF